MLKRFKFYFRYLTAPYRMRKWLNGQTLMVFAGTVVFLTVLAMTLPDVNDVQEATAQALPGAVAQQQEPSPPPPNPSPTRQATLNPEYLQNANQTVGLTLVGAFLVLVVVMGVLVFMPKDEEA